MINYSIDDPRRKFYDSKRLLPQNIGTVTELRYLYQYCSMEALGKIEKSKAIKSTAYVDLTGRSAKDQEVLKGALREIYLTDNGDLSTEGSRISNALPSNAYPTCVIKLDYRAMLNEGLCYDIKRNVTGNLQNLKFKQTYTEKDEKTGLNIEKERYPNLTGIGGGTEYLFDGNTKSIPIRFFVSSKDIESGNIKYYSGRFNKEQSIDNNKNKFYDSNSWFGQEIVQESNVFESNNYNIYDFTMEILDSTGVYRGAYYFYKNYYDMKEANTINADKYFHCKANFETSRSGLFGRYWATLFSHIREESDKIFNKLRNNLNDSAEDHEANVFGRQQALDKSIRTSRDGCSKKRPRGLNEKY
ncbi:MAG: hypothetical protein LBQ22_06945 [Bacteroidales bacterium]|jgi:hypothetical protein|nr:hypothetical protein [Bacteroidales bacterium]